MSDNVIINGNFDIWQRGVSFNKAPHFTATCDRFVFGQSSGAAEFNISRSTDVPNYQSQYSLDISVYKSWIPELNDEAHIRYGIEGRESTLKIAGKVVTFSFWIKSNTTGIYSIALVHPNADRSQEKALLLEYEIFTPDVWEKKVVTADLTSATGGWSFASATYGLKIRFSFYAGTGYKTAPNTWIVGNYVASNDCENLASAVGNYLRISQLKLEVGNEATDFIPEDITSQLVKCQRYCFTIGGAQGGVMDSFGITGAAASGNEVHYNTITYPTNMCKNPVVKCPDGPMFTANVSDIYWNCGASSASMKVVSAQAGRFAVRSGGYPIVFDAEF